MILQAMVECVDNKAEDSSESHIQNDVVELVDELIDTVNFECSNKEVELHKDLEKEERAVAGKSSKDEVASSSKNDFKYFKVKKIRFGPLEFRIVTQNMNGPCPLVALTNSLVLKGKITVPDHHIVGQDVLVNILSNALLEQTVEENRREIFEANLTDVLPMLPNIVNGLDVNVKFSSINAFEFTTALSLFDLLNITLYHVWLPDPQFPVLYNAVKNLTYNELVCRMCNDDDREAEFLREFHNSTISQITFHGLSTLISNMKDGEIAVLFLNNHFHTILKRRNEIFTLVTDEGLADEKNIVWESLSSVDGDSFFVNADFHTYRHQTGSEAAPNELPPPPAYEKQLENDFNLALKIQKEEGNVRSLTETSKQPKEIPIIPLTTPLSSESRSEETNHQRESEPPLCEPQTEPAKSELSSQEYRVPTLTERKRDCKIL